MHWTCTFRIKNTIKSNTPVLPLKCKNTKIQNFSNPDQAKLVWQYKGMKCFSIGQKGKGWTCTFRVKTPTHRTCCLSGCCWGKNSDEITKRIQKKEQSTTPVEARMINVEHALKVKTPPHYTCRAPQLLSSVSDFSISRYLRYLEKTLLQSGR